jgi:putative ABC transport system permease protein
MGKSELLLGTLDMLILKVLNRGPMHGFGIAQRIEQLSDEFLSVGEGSLYPALYRLQQRGWVESEWGQSENNRRAKCLRSQEPAANNWRPKPPVGNRCVWPLLELCNRPEERAGTMEWIVNGFRRLCALFQRRKLDEEMDEEMRVHLELRTLANIEKGMAPEEARYAALRRFGWVEIMRRTCREQRGIPWLEDLPQDLRFGLRLLLKNPGVAAIAVASLALGISLNSAIFALVDGLWLRSRPFADPSRVVRIFGSTPQHRRGDFSFLDYLDLRTQMASVSGLAVNERRGTVLEGKDDSVDLRADTVSRNVFSVLGIKPHLGRFFSETDEPELKNLPAVVLSHRLWQRRFGGDTNLVGKPIVLSGQSLTVLGIAPPGFGGLERLNPAEVWYPPEVRPMDTSRNDRSLDVTGRLKPGYTVAQAQSEAETIFRRLDLRDPASHTPLKALVLTEAGYQFEQTGKFGWLLLAIGGVILLLACANVSSLLLARAEVRGREMAVRSALGGSRGRLVRQSMAESLVLALLAGTLSVLLAKWLIAALPSVVPPDPLDAIALLVRMDIRVLVFTGFVALVTVFLFGLVPAAHVTGPDLIPALKSDLAWHGPGRRGIGLRSIVVGQMSLTVALVSMAAVLTRSLWAAYAADLGFEKREILLARPGFPNVGQKPADFQQLKERVAALPGVRRVSIASLVPLSPWGTGASQEVFYRGWRHCDGRWLSGWVQRGRSGLPGPIRIRVLRGRGFIERDDKSGQRVMLISEAMARKFWPEADPVGRFVRLGSPTNELVEIVGVVRDTKLNGIDETPLPYLYLPLAQYPGWECYLLAEATGKAVSLTGAVRDELVALGLKPSQLDIGTIKGFVRTKVSGAEFLARVAVPLSLLALVLASIGLYGVLGYSVGRRTREIGVRIALGAQRAEVLRMILREGLTLALVGLALGALLTLAVGYLCRSLVYGVSPLDAPSLAASGLLLLVAAGVATFFPARRATRVDPLASLRYE